MYQLEFVNKKGVDYAASNKTFQSRVFGGQNENEIREGNAADQTNQIFVSIVFI